MRVLVILHGMLPQAGHTVVGSGLRAFANGEGLRARGHEVLYCTRTEDLPDDLKALATAKRGNKHLLRQPLDRDALAPGDEGRIGRELTATEPGQPAPADPAEDEDTFRGRLGTSNGLAPKGGPLGAPGNPYSFTEPHELQDVVRRVSPDVVLVEALEEARALPRGEVPVVLDLFAPRILEQQFQPGADEREAVRVLDAIQRGDHFLFSNERQKYFHLPLLALAGVDCTADAGSVVPISCPPELPTPAVPDELTFVAGGVFWPWADIGRGLRGLVDLLDEAGEGRVHLYGGKYGIRSDTERYADPRQALPQDHDRVEFKGLVPIDELWADYAACSVAFDLMAPNPEREINLSFRQIDYLRCGLPIITSPRQVIAPDIAEYGAGWLLDPEDRDGLRALVQRLIEFPEEIAQASAAAQRLARDKYSWDVTVDQLDRIVRAPLRRQRRDTFVGQLTRTQGDLWDEVEDNRKLRKMLERRDDDLAKKSEEVRRQDARIMQLMGTVDRLTLSLSDVSGFKNEAITYLGQSEDAALREAAELGRELERKELDLLKKDDALKKAQKEVAKLKKAVGELKDDHKALEAKFVGRDREALALAAERDQADDLRQQAQTRTEGLRTDLAKKEAELHALQEQRREELEDLQAKLEAALAAQATAKTERDGAEGTIAELRARIASGQADRAKKEAELQQAREQLEAQQDQAQEALAAKDAELARVLERLERQRTRTEAEFQRLQATGLNQLERAEAGARAVAEDLRDKASRLAEERAQLQGQVAEATHRLRDVERSLRNKEQLLVEARRSAEANIDRMESDRDRQLAELGEQLATARRQAESAKAKAAQAREEALRLRSRVEDLSADADKKTRALAEASRERDRVEARAITQIEQAEDGARDLLETVRARAARLQAERGQQRATLEQRNHELAELRRRVQELEPLANQGRRLKSKVDDLEADVAKKDAALGEADRDRQRQSDGFLATLARAEDKARSLLEQARDRIARLEGERGTTLASLEQARHELADAKQKLTAAAPALEEADRLRAQVVDQKSDLAKKDAALREARRERERLEEAFRGTLDRAEAGARSLLEEAKDRVADLEAERGELRSSLERSTHDLAEARRRLSIAEPKVMDAEQLRGRVDDLKADVAKKEAALGAADKERRRLEQAFLGRLEQAETRARDLVDGLGDRIAELEGERGRLTGALERSRHQLLEAKRRLEQVEPELRELDRLRGRATDLEGEVAAKTKALAAAGAERERLSAEFLTNLEAAEDQASRLLTELSERLSDADAERGKLRARLERTSHELGEAKRQLKSREAEAGELKDQLTEAREREAKLRLDGGAADADLLRATHRIEELETELAARKKELATVERTARAEAARLEDAAREAAQRATEAREALEGRLTALQSARAELEATSERQAARLRDLEGDVAKKTAALAAEGTERMRLERAFLTRLEQAETEARELVDGLGDRIAQLEGERGRLTGQVERGRHQLLEAKRRLEQVEPELRELDRVRGRVTDLEGEVAAKTKALAEAGAERERLSAEFLTNLESAEDQAARLLGELTERLGDADGERGRLRARVERLTHELGEAKRQLKSRDAEASELKDQLTEAREREAKLRLDGGSMESDLARATHRLEELETELAARKKELAATERSARAEAARLEDAAREAAQRATEAREALESRLSALQTARAELEATSERQGARLRDLEADVAKKTAALAAEGTERTRLEARFLADLESARAQADALLEQARDRVGELTSERGRLMASLEQARHNLRDAERNLVAREEELRERERQANADDARRDGERARSEREAAERLAEVRASLAEARSQRDALTGELEQAKARLVDLEADAAAKTEALDGARREQTRLGEQFVAQLEAAEARATEMLTETRARIESLAAHRAELLADADRLGYRVSALEQDLAVKTAALDSSQAAEAATAERLEATTAELSEVRIRADRDNARLVELEAEARRERLERERQRDVLNQQGGQLEEAEFEASTRAEDQAKLEAELVEAVNQRDAAVAELSEVVPVLTERAESAEQQLNEAQGQLAEAQFNVESLTADVAKKNGEIDAAQSELDQLRRAIAELEERLNQPQGIAARLRGR